MTVMVLRYLILISMCDFISISVFSLVLVLIEIIYQKLKTVFDDISKHLKVHQKYSNAHSFFNSLFGVLKCGQTQSFIFDMLHLSGCTV